MLTIIQGGFFPHMNVWNEQGQRLGEATPDYKLGAGDHQPIKIKHNFAGDESTGSTASYILVSNPDVDAICVSAIIIRDENLETAWFGDIGKHCGYSWGISDRDIGEEHYRPSCMWLDDDGTNGINSQALSFHIPDMVANNQRLVQYSEYPDTLCKSTPRMSNWGNLDATSQIPMFDPPLLYKTDPGK